MEKFMTAALCGFALLVGADKTEFFQVPREGMLLTVVMVLVIVAFNLGRMRPCKVCRKK